MPGWSREKRLRVEANFYSYLNKCFVNTKDYGRICLGENLYFGQRYAIGQIFDALEQDKHDVYILKSRQLGVSTLFRALTVFLLGVHRGLKGAIVFDTDENKQQARTELTDIIEELPKSLKFPAIKNDNRVGVTLENSSQILFKSAGIKKSKSSGTLGRSVGLSVAHCSEMCSWDNDEGLRSFKESLSDLNPDRLYLWESTARGFNRWFEMWEEARKDTAHCKCIFLGWWAKDSQRIDRDHRDFDTYALIPPSEKEAEKIDQVKRLYNVDITIEQLAWYRRKMDPTAEAEGDADPEFEGDTIQVQEQPWCVVAGTRVGTELGLIPIEEAIHAARCSRGKIVAGGPTGRASIWRARTKLGYELRGTANHPLITTDGSQVDLAASKGLRVRLQPPALAEEFYTVSWREPPALCQIKITPDVARFVGLFMGDGSASNHNKYKTTEVSICCDAKDIDVIDECKQLFKKVFAVEATLNSRDGWVTVRSGVKTVLQTLERLALLREDVDRTARKVHVPEFIWRSPKAIIKEFLRGLFEADGFNAFETNRVALFSKYPDFIKDIQLLLLAFGITSRNVSMRKRAGDGHFYTGNQLELRTAEAIRFNHEIGFISSRKRGRFNPVAYEKKWSDRRRGNSKRPVILFEDEVVEVMSENCVEEVWNLTVEGEHLFDANGILTHNTEEEAFQQTGAIFFSSEKLTEVTRNDVSNKFNSYFYSVGTEFTNTLVIKANTAKMSELKVWDEPDPDGFYVMGIDPAFGENENNDRSSIQVLRCYADGLDQVAEYASPLIRTEQLAWVIASLMGWYGAGQNAQVKYALEINGPGAAVFNELRSLRYQIESHSYLEAQIQERGLKDIFRNVRTYLYTRPDAVQAGSGSFHIKTTQALKITFMERLRDYVSNGKFRVRSMDLVKEMKTIAREGDTIKAPGSMKDDRVLAAAFAVHCWETGPRKQLIVSNRTREAEMARKRLNIGDQINLYQQNQLQYFFAAKRRARLDRQITMTRQSWRR